MIKIYKTSRVIIFIIFIITSICSGILLYCDNIEFKDYQPANPPSGIEIIVIATGNHAGDYLLCFCSENRSNLRFGGFFIYIDYSRETVLEMNSMQEADYILGALSPETDSTNYNTGIDSDIVVLFSDITEHDAEIIIDDKTYTVTKKLAKSGITAGLYLTARTYLYDEQTLALLDISSPGNSVLIE